MWVVQSNFLDVNQINPVVDALNEFGIPFQDVGVIPFSDEFITPLETDEVNIIPYGSTALMRIAEKRKWTGLYFDHSTFRVDRWINERQKDLLNDDAFVLEVRDAMKFFETNDHYDDEEWFIRPVEDLKAFNGTLTVGKEIKRWMESVDSGNFSFGEHTEVALSRPKEILMEWRYFIVNRKIVTGSSYRYKGMKLTKREEDPEVIAEAQKMADGWLPHETCVMDLALTPNGLKIVEFNCLNSSGFYYHNIRDFVKSVTEYAEKQWS